jgi:hypothetical protein
MASLEPTARLTWDPTVSHSPYPSESPATYTSAAPSHVPSAQTPSPTTLPLYAAIITGKVAFGGITQEEFNKDEKLQQYIKTDLALSAGVDPDSVAILGTKEEEILPERRKLLESLVVVDFEIAYVSEADARVAVTALQKVVFSKVEAYVLSSFPDKKIKVDVLPESFAVSLTRLSCTDEILDGDETDVDCGGPLCLPCGIGFSCEADSDCVSRQCEISYGSTIGMCVASGNGKLILIISCSTVSVVLLGIMFAARNWFLTTSKRRNGDNRDVSDSSGVIASRDLGIYFNDLDDLTATLDVQQQDAGYQDDPDLLPSISTAAYGINGDVFPDILKENVEYTERHQQEDSSCVDAGSDTVMIYPSKEDNFGFEAII